METPIKFLVFNTNKNLGVVTAFFLESRYNFKVTTIFSPEEMVEVQWVISNFDSLKSCNELTLFLKEKPEVKAMISYAKQDLSKMSFVFDVIATIDEVKLFESLNAKLAQFFEPDVSTGALEFTPISIVFLKSLKKFNEDVYIKLNSGRYLKLFNRDDPATIEDYEKYEAKNISRFWIKKSSFIWVSKKLQQVIPEILANPNYEIAIEPSPENFSEELNSTPTLELQEQMDSSVDADLQVTVRAQMQEQVEEQEQLQVEDEVQIEKEEINSEEINSVMKNAEEFKFNGPFEIEAAFLQELHSKLPKTINAIKNNKDLLKLIKGIDRSNKDMISLKIEYSCNITCAIARLMEWGSDATYEKLIYCSHIQDMKLFKYPELFRIQTLYDLEKIPNLTPEQRELYLSHPDEVTKIIKADEMAPQDVDIIISQHHVLPGGRGFPPRFNASRIMPFAALLNIASDMAQNMIDYGNKWELKTFIEEREPRYKGGIFLKIFKTIEPLMRGTAKIK
ncbi:MAG: hypothetical protein HQK50_13880 [Oligoflexia bacterium]|nr:hypothetical protein [Oligoflexia bacterium]MBF0366658.1 hypothetical protein [Oligoflexia bacterium]